MKNYRESRVWEMGILIVDAVYEITDKFPTEEKYGLALQMQRSAISIPSNIAEGFARQHTKEDKQFCSIALGSCAELETQLIIAQRRNYISKEESAFLEEQLNHESRMLENLKRRLADKNARTTVHGPRTTEAR